MNRRTFLRAVVLSPVGLGHALGLRSTARAAAAGGKAKACIQFFMTGDPSPNTPISVQS